MKRALVALALLLVAWKGDAPRPTPQSTTTTTVPRPVRVGVFLPPDPAANTYGGGAVRALVHPQLFRATPEGRWQASLIEPGSDATGKGALTASFRLRLNARWSDGSPITVADLRRTLNPQFVERVDDPTTRGTIVVHFKQALREWRRLWSGLESVAPAAPGVYGGPYRVERVTPGLETVLVANDHYYGTKPRVREVRLVLVPAAETQARLMERGDLDVIAPLAFTGRTARLERIDNADVLAGSARRGGWTATLVANPSRLTQPQRQALFSLGNAPRFVDVLLQGEATATGERVAAPDPLPPVGTAPAVSAPLESGPASLLLHAMQRAGYKAGRAFDLRQGDFDRILGVYASAGYDALFNLQPSLLDVATAGADQITSHVVLPLWRERPVAAVREGLRNVSVNGYSAGGPLWNAESWRWSG